MMKSLVKFNFLPNGLRWEEEIRLVKEYGEYGIFEENETEKEPTEKEKIEREEAIELSIGLDGFGLNPKENEPLPKTKLELAIEAGIIPAGKYVKANSIDSIRAKRNKQNNSRRGKFDNNYYVKRKVETRDGFNFDIGINKRFDCPCLKISYNKIEVKESRINNKIIQYKSLVSLNDDMSFVYPSEIDIKEGNYICEKDSDLFLEFANYIKSRLTITRVYTAKGRLRQFWNLQQKLEKYGIIETAYREIDNEADLWDLVFEKIEFIYEVESLKGNNAMVFTANNHRKSVDLI